MWSSSGNKKSGAGPRISAELKALLESAPDAMLVVSEVGAIVSANDEAASMFGYDREELPGRSADMLMPKRYRARHRRQRNNLFSDIRRGRKGRTTHLCGLHQKGGEFEVEVTVGAVEGEQGLLALVAVRDISERKRAEERLRQSEARLARVLRIGLMGNWDWDLVNDSIECSDEVYRIMGVKKASFERSLGSFLAYVHPEDRVAVREKVMHLVKTSRGHQIEHRIVRPDGEERVVLQHAEAQAHGGRTKRIIGTIQDITERTRLAEQNRMQAVQLSQTNKMASLGTLVSGIAHEINNPTQSLLMNSQVLADVWVGVAKVLQHFEEENAGTVIAGLSYREICESVPTVIDDIRYEAQRIKNIVGNLKEFAQPRDTVFDPGAGSSYGPKKFDLNESVRRGLSLIEHRLRRMGETLTVNLADNLPPIAGDMQKLEQVVINLVSNGLDALPDGDPRVAIMTRFDQTENCVELVVEDHGVGIPEDLLEHIFEPFFTTKESKGGTGLGLVICSKLVREHHGTIAIDSHIGQGTTVGVRLPCAHAEPEDTADVELMQRGQA